MTVKNRSSRTTAGWRAKAPHSPHNRRTLFAKCGKRAFLSPQKMSFPVMDKSCAYDCEGVRSAFARAKQFGHSAIAAKAHKLGKRLKCHWAV